jgi:hypothetical protein
MVTSKLVYPAAEPEDEWELPQIDGDWGQLSSYIMKLRKKYSHKCVWVTVFQGTNPHF